MSAALWSILKPWLENKPAGERLWPGNWHDDAAAMLRVDLEAAGIPYQAEDGSYLDFHATRHTGITRGSKVMRIDQLRQFTRRSKIGTTMRYVHTDADELRERADRLSAPGCNAGAPSNQGTVRRTRKCDHGRGPKSQRASSSRSEVQRTKNETQETTANALGRRYLIALMLAGRYSAQSLKSTCTMICAMVRILSFTSAHLTRPSRILSVLLCTFFLAGGTAGASAAEVTRPWRVLMVHSFGRSAPPFTTHSTAFESAIAKELGTAVDLDEVSLDMARYAQPDMEEAFAEYLTNRLSRWQPDLVVPIGSPAGRFVANFRDRLFSKTPVVYTGMDKRTLPADAFADNAAFVGEDFDLQGLVQDMLQLAPQTKNVVVILGATPLEQYWTEAFRQAFEPFKERLQFRWVNDLSFEQMRDLVSKLPPHSSVLMGLLLRDASGVTYNQDDALARLNEVSRAPIFGMYRHQVGMGVVGGRLYQGELQGTESARVAAQILRGEPASSFAPLVIGTSEPTYDWRALRRWQISESRLPPGSVVLFRQPTAWQRYRWHVIAGLAVISAQGLLILALLFQRRRRHRAESAYKVAQAQVEQKWAELAHVSRVAVFGELTASLAHELNQPLAAVLCNSGAARKFLEAPQPDLQEVGEALADIEDDATRAGEIVRRLRDMLKRDTTSRDFTDVDVNQVIRNVDRIVHSDALRHGVTVHLELSGGGLPLIKGDVVQLQQVLLNLMINALHAMKGAESSGPRHLILRTRLADGSKVLVEVEDNGIGIPSENLESIFEPFVTSKQDGLGMGLSICRSIIQRHGGSIWAASNPDRGATFSIALPAYSHEPQFVASAKSTPARMPRRPRTPN